MMRKLMLMISLFGQLDDGDYMMMTRLISLFCQLDVDADDDDVDVDNASGPV
jgi:hypothetical protein